MMTELVEEIAMTLHDYERRVGIRPDLVPKVGWSGEPERIKSHYRCAAIVVLGTVGPQALTKAARMQSNRWHRILTGLSRFWKRNICDTGPDDPSSFDRRSW